MKRLGEGLEWPILERLGEGPLTDLFPGDTKNACSQVNRFKNNS